MKLNSLLLDADVVIDAHSLGMWDKLLAQNRVHIGAVVLRTEVKYYIDNNGRPSKSSKIPELRPDFFP